MGLGSFGAMCGGGRGELCALDWCAVDWYAVD